MTLREGKWNCPSCGTPNRGADLDCRGCGVRRGADVRFYLEPDAPAVTDPGALKVAGTGPDWHCGSCGVSNRAGSSACHSCGASRESSPSAPVQSAEEESLGKEIGLYLILPAFAFLVFIFYSLAQNADEEQRRQAARDIAREKAAAARLVPRTVDVVVRHSHWERRVVVQTREEVIRDDWKPAVPKDARVISQTPYVETEYQTREATGSRTEYQSYDDTRTKTVRYRCGSRDLGNGYFEDKYCTRQESYTVTRTRPREVTEYANVTRTGLVAAPEAKDVPDSRIKVTYAIKAWVDTDTLNAQGDDQSPVWPPFQEVPHHKRLKPERVEHYSVEVCEAAAKRCYQVPVTLAQLQAYRPGSRGTLRVNGHGVLGGPEALQMEEGTNK